LALSLISLPAFERLYHIGQYGSYWFGIPEADTNRAEHSLGVYYLLRHFGASREEQIAGLLHDISHTVFSHVIDYVWANDSQGQTSQDKSHAAIIAQEPVKGMLERFGFDCRVIGDLERHKLLDRELPDLCADRLDYFLRDSVCYKEITPEEAMGILKKLDLANSTIAVIDADVARFLVKHSIMMTWKHWGPAWGCFMFERTAEAIRLAFQEGLITKADFFSTDKEIWQKIKQSANPKILKAVSDVENIRQIKLCLDEKDYDYHLYSKFRVMDPLVLTSAGTRRVTEIFPELAKTLAEEKESFNHGHYIKIIR